MARRLLPPTAIAADGPWVETMPPGSRNFPARVTAVGSGAGGVGWTAGPIHIEHYVDGRPDVPIELGQIAPPFGDLIVSAPVEFIRARTDAAQAGTVEVWMVPSL